MENKDLEFSQALIALFKGVIWENQQTRLWNAMQNNHVRIEDYVSKIGLTLIVSEEDGYAYLKQRNTENDEPELPRLISKRSLGFGVSLLLVLLRKEVIEIGKSSDSTRFIIEKDDIMEKVKAFYKETTDEAKQRREIESNLAKIEEMGFIRKLKGQDARFEIMPIIRGFVDAEWLENINNLLAEYAKHGGGSDGLI